MRLAGLCRCMSCGATQWALYTVDGVIPFECDPCGAMACVPEGPQYQAGAFAATALADAVMNDWLDTRVALQARRAIS